MPPLRRCITCGTLITTGSRCSQHQYRNGSTRSWRHLRAYILKRDGGVCGICGQPDANTVDHILPLAHGGTDEPSNLQAAHATCNRSKSASLQ